MFELRKPLITTTVMAMVIATAMEKVMGKVTMKPQQNQREFWRDFAGFGLNLNLIF